MKYLSLFSGVGGFELGINRAYGSYFELHERQTRQGDESQHQNAGEHSELRRREHQPICIGFAEFNPVCNKLNENEIRCRGKLEWVTETKSKCERCGKFTTQYANAIYRFNFPEHANLGDATRIISDELPDFDFLCAGFPCQSFSRAGKRKGFSDTRGTMFFEVQRILADKRPAHFLLENVADLVNHEQGKTFQTILGILSDLGYFVETIILDSKDFGVPQQRKRIFFIGHLGDECSREILSFGAGDETIVDRMRDSFCQTLVAGHRGGVKSKTFSNEGFETENIPLKLGYANGLRETSVFNCLDANYDKSVAKQDRPFILQRGRGFNQGRVKEICPTLSCNDFQNNQPIIDENFRIRRLTPVEFARLQGFPDDWAKFGRFDNDEIKEISDTQQYKVFGNAVTVNVIEAIVTEMIPCFER